MQHPLHSVAEALWLWGLYFLLIYLLLISDWTFLLAYLFVLKMSCKGLFLYLIFELPNIMFTGFLLPTIVFLLSKKYAEMGAIYCTYRKNEKMCCSSSNAYFCMGIFASTLKNRLFFFFFQTSILLTFTW